MKIEALEPEHPVYGTFRARSLKGRLEGAGYIVEIRALDDFLNSCSCPDYGVNGLGTCKHIEAVLAHVHRTRSRLIAREAGSQRIEIYLSRRGGMEIRVAWPKVIPIAARRLIGCFFSGSGALLGDSLTVIPALRRALSSASGRSRTAVRIGRDVDEWVASLQRQQARQKARDSFLLDVRAGRQSLDFLKVPLYPYQVDGMMHLAFNERALLADEMGLGKTVQAVAACELLRRTRRIERVLVVSPASLKAEWEEQIAKFTGLPARIVWGPRAERLRLYREPSFFYLVNYEQVRADVEDIGRLVAPDVVILDEAQRIKNWQTATANAVKRLSSPYAFVLTGTPLENRIDEIYSIFQVIDPHLLGPLFRFNREFYEMDSRGMPQGYRNLEELRRRIRPFMLRRRKDEVEDQLPKRTVNNYFVAMAPEQKLRYEEYNARVARLLTILKRRPLTREEVELLQKWLACMRMICDTPYILDPECRLSPKLGELTSILEEVLESKDNKVLIFSEWERMLELVREKAEEMSVGFAWHTGSVPQKARRGEINRFKSDPECRLFLSSDAGSVGLNLQAANVVVNLDLPWNPARLEQRIARAWRKHQTRPVSVINIVSSDSIEHRMLGLLTQKQQLADGVLDGRGDLDAIKMPSGRVAFLERLQGLMGVDLTAPASTPGAAETARAPRPAADPYETFRQDVSARLSERLLLLEVSGNGAGRRSVVAVVEGAVEHWTSVLNKSLRDNFPDNGAAPQLEILDRPTYETIRRLMHAGVLKRNSTAARLHQSPLFSDADAISRQQRRAQAWKIFESAGRKMRMSTLLRDAGFAAESLPACHDAVLASLRALSYLDGCDEAAVQEHVPSPHWLHSRFIAPGLLPESAGALLARLKASVHAGEEMDGETAGGLFQEACRFHEQTQILLNQSALA
jgi:superfamily II DNA or RNA helicase